MSKKIFSAVLICMIGCGIMLSQDKNPDRMYANLVFTVFELDDLETEIASKLKMPIPEVHSKSWIHAYYSLDLSEGRLPKETIEKRDFRFILSAESQSKLSIKVMYKNQDRFYFEHCKPSSAYYIFYGENCRAYFMEVVFTTADHPIGPLGPGIRR